MKKILIILVFAIISLTSFSQTKGYYIEATKGLIVASDTLTETTKMSTLDTKLATQLYVLSVAGAGGTGWDSLYVNETTGYVSWWYGGLAIDSVTLNNVYLSIEDSANYVTPTALSTALATTNNRVSYEVRLPAASTVFDRINGAISYPVDWSLAVGTSAVDIVITHGLGRRVTSVTVFARSGNSEQQLFNTAAYNGVISESPETLRIQSLATIQTEIVIYINFAQ